MWHNFQERFLPEDETMEKGSNRHYQYDDLQRRFLQPQNKRPNRLRKTYNKMIEQLEFNLEEVKKPICPVCGTLFKYKYNKTYCSVECYSSMHGHGKEYWDSLLKKDKKELTKKEKKALKDKKYRETHAKSLKIKKKEYNKKVNSIISNERKNKEKEIFNLLSLRPEEKEWFPLEEWEDTYEIRHNKETDEVELRYKHNKKILLPCFSKRNKKYVFHLQNKNKKSSIAVHILASKIFLKNPNNLPSVKHKDGDIKNNKISNLSWSETPKRLAEKSNSFKGIINVYKDGIFLYSLKGKKQIKDKGFCDSSVYNCVYGISESHRGYTFERHGLSEEEKKEKQEMALEKKIKDRPKRTKYMSDRLKTDPEFKILNMLRKRVRNAIKGKKHYKSIDLLGCTVLDARCHLEKQFKEGMSWENHGKYGWHIDHIIPCASFDLTDLEQQKKCFHYTNLQPLWANENLSKGAKIL
jgi:hypothetical protein